MRKLTTPFEFESTADEVIRGVDLTGKRAVVTGATADWVWRPRARWRRPAQRS